MYNKTLLFLGGSAIQNLNLSYGVMVCRLIFYKNDNSFFNSLFGSFDDTKVVNCPFLCVFQLQIHKKDFLDISLSYIKFSIYI